MRKTFIFLIVATLAAFGASCNRDDNVSSKETDPTQLIVKANKTEIIEGEAVNFTVILNGKIEKDAELFNGNEKIQSKQFFQKPGKYTVIAKKSGAKNSTPMKIIVQDINDAKKGKFKKLNISVESLDVNINEEVKFKVTDGENEVTNVEITSPDLPDGTVIKDGIWKPKNSGVYTFIASKEGYKRSSSIFIVVAQRPLTKNFFDYQGIQHPIDMAIFLYNSEKEIGDTTYDTYNLQLSLFHRNKLVNWIVINVSYPRADPNVVTLPTDGVDPIINSTETLFAVNRDNIFIYGSNDFTLKVQNLEPFKTVDEKELKAPHGIITFDFGLKESTDRFTGNFEGPVRLFQEEPYSVSNSNTDFKLLRQKLKEK